MAIFLPSTRAGMGTILYDIGAAFRVWAPFAKSVAVAGDFNGWSITNNFLAAEGNDFWSADIDGVKIGDQYKFVIDTGNGLLWRKNPYASSVLNSAGNAIVHDPTFDWSDDHFIMPAWNELVIYELHVETFNDPASTQPGHFADLITKLPYLSALGVNALEIMPVAQFPTDYSWGYNPSQPFAVDSSIGGPQGFYQLIKAAHANGLAVILDVVYNHFGPSDLDLWDFDGWTDANHPGGIYFYDNNRAYTPWGNNRPDYGRGEVRQFIRDNALFWLNKYRVDGLRMDAVSYVRNRYGHNNDAYNDLPDGWSLLQWIHREIQSSQPWKITIAEDLQNNNYITLDGASGGAGFGSQWDASFVHPIRQAIIAGNDADRDMFAVKAALEHSYNGNATQRVIYTESHDEDSNGHSRVPEEIWPGFADSWFSKKRSTLGAALVFTAPGIPMIFQGQEFLEDGYFRDNTPYVPLDWARLETFKGIQILYRDLIHLRRNWFNNTRGLAGQHINVFHVNPIDKVIAFHRYQNGGPGDDVIIVANFGNRSYANYRIGLPRAGHWQVRFNSDWNGYSNDFGNFFSYGTSTEQGYADGLSFYANVGIGPYSAVIYSQDN
jgi:1,4-alpha-glucan branching enzyme